MSKEIFEMMQGIGWKEIETQLALQCAPLLTGIKISNILIIERENAKRIVQILHKTCIDSFVLYETEEKVTLLLYHKQELVEYLNQPQIIHFFYSMGYHSSNIKSMVRKLKKRYAVYMETKEDFPHELGLLLGYPIEDVSGFIRNQGKNYLCSGYWKVYQDAERKIRLFEQYEQAKEHVVKLILRGLKIAEIIDIYHNHISRSI